MKTRALLAIALVGCSAAAAPDLKAVMQKLGEDAKAREAAPCTYREVTTVEELGKNDEVVGAEVRTFDVEVKGQEVLRREVVSVTKSGAELADLLQQQRDTKGKKPARGPLHPESQPDYAFALKPGPGDSSTVTIEPLKPNAERMRGEAVVNSRLELTELRLTPSKVPLLLKSLAMRFEFVDTACGRQPSLVEIQGQGVAVFIDTRFRTKSILGGHAHVAATKKK